MSCQHQMRGVGMFLGVLLVVLGTFLLLGEMHLLGDLTRYWPVALIALGVAQLFGRARHVERRPHADGENGYGPANS